MHVQRSKRIESSIDANWICTASNRPFPIWVLQTAFLSNRTLSDTVQPSWSRCLEITNLKTAALAAAHDEVVECEWLDSKMASNPSLLPEIGPDGLAKEAPVISYTEKVLSVAVFVWLCHCCIAFSLFFFFFLQIIEAEQLQLQK